MKFGDNCSQGVFSLWNIFKCFEVFCTAANLETLEEQSFQGNLMKQSSKFSFSWKAWVRRLSESTSSGKYRGDVDERNRKQSVQWEKLAPEKSYKCLLAKSLNYESWVAISQVLLFNFQEPWKVVFTLPVVIARNDKLLHREAVGVPGEVVTGCVGSCRLLGCFIVTGWTPTHLAVALSLGVVSYSVCSSNSWTWTILSEASLAFKMKTLGFMSTYTSTGDRLWTTLVHF